MTTDAVIRRGPQRWDNPFGGVALTNDPLASLLALPVFGEIDQDGFPTDLALIDILAHDARIRQFNAGDVIARKGDYGNSFFVVMSGDVRGLFEDQQTPETLQRSTKRNHSISRTLGMVLKRIGGSGEVAEVRQSDDGPKPPDNTVVAPGPTAPRSVTSIGDIEHFLAANDTYPIKPHQSFGESAALTRGPRDETIISASDGATVVELGWQGLRDIRRWSSSFRAYIDARYREQSLNAFLRSSALFRHLNEATLSRVGDDVRFESHGRLDWFKDFKIAELEGEEGSKVKFGEPVIVEQGHYLDGVIIVRAGYARETRRRDGIETTTRFHAGDSIFGLEEYVAARNGAGDGRLKSGLRAIGFVDILRVPADSLDEYVISTLSAQQMNNLLAGDNIGEYRTISVDANQETSGLLEFLVDRRLFNGEAAMVIDLDKCVHCDDCVRACAATHDGNPRFVRQGPQHDRFQIANACMHCTDSICLIGCPTGAIRRDVVSGNVLINDKTCVGCETCVKTCPYDNIKMVEIRDPAGGFVVGADDRIVSRATKCDLCEGVSAGPACQAACPHDALKRVNLGRAEDLVSWRRA
jgi:Fe-S-cluster-containing hydrogenase component 2/CRP-like cAMP-binding protein